MAGRYEVGKILENLREKFNFSLGTYYNELPTRLKPLAVVIPFALIDIGYALGNLDAYGFTSNIHAVDLIGNNSINCTINDTSINLAGNFSALDGKYEMTLSNPDLGKDVAIGHAIIKNPNTPPTLDQIKAGKL